ncbi:lipid scramblase CLPTM1L-like [Brachionichthys hirsutus]|uniref:lipid scramblase CLPTM1L-like n=1 Tax=Brachionichthys hirsutus TaxID=412623 RepID=UPI0036044C47
MFPSCYSKPGDGGAKRCSIAKVLLGVFVVYTLHTVWVLSGFLSTKPCDGGRGDLCITSYLAARPGLQLSVFTCLVPDNSQLNLAVKIHPFDPHSTFERQVNVSLPQETRANGSLYAVVYVHKAGISPLEDSGEVHFAAQLTAYTTPKRTEEQRDMKRPSPRSANPVSHWKPHLPISMMSEDFTFSKAAVPSDVRRYMRVSQDGQQMIYLPLLLVDELSFRVRDLMEINSSIAQLPLTVSYEGISLRGFRFSVHLQDVVYSLRQFGFSEEYVEKIKETLVGSNLYLLVVTALITALQLMCEFLALKNDISSWRKKKKMGGMSRNTVLWRSLSTLLIFLHLLEETSLLVLLPVGLGACVEVWKVFKVFNFQPQLKNSKLHVKMDEGERKTVEYDREASTYLSYLVYPLCISGAIFSLAYLHQKSYFSWLMNTLVTGVYAFGFLSMGPQLFINYKLQSVSHLQGAVLMYRGVNTLITDLCSCASFFSSSESLSSPHQLSCFRDELLFFLYLYQRRQYNPKARKRESGMHIKKLKTQ